MIFSHVLYQLSYLGAETRKRWLIDGNRRASPGRAAPIRGAQAPGPAGRRARRWASRPLWLVFFGFARAIYRQTWLLLREPAGLTLTCHRAPVKQAAAAGRVLGEEIWGVEIVNDVDSATYGKSSHSVHR